MKLKYLFAFILLSTAIIISCSDDAGLDINTNQNAAGQPQYEILRGKSAVNALKMFHTEAEKRQITGRGVEDFELNENEVLKLTDSKGVEHHTYFVVDTETDSEKSFSNVVISEYNQKRKVTLIQYEMEGNFAEDFYSDIKPFEEFTGNMHFSVLSADEGFDCPEEPNIPIPVSGGHGTGGGGGSSGGGGAGGGGTGGGGGNTSGPGGGSAGNGNPYNQGIVNFINLSLQIKVMNTKPEDEWIEVSRSPRYFSVPPADNSLTLCGNGREIGILLPDDKITNCDDLKSKSQHTDFKVKLQDLKDKAATQNFESAYVLNNVASSGLALSNEITGTSENPEVFVDRAISDTTSVTNCIGLMHCHLDQLIDGKPRTYKVFSFSDLVGFAKLVSQSTRPTHEFVLYVTTSSGTFALKVNKRSSLITNYQRMVLAQNSYERAFAKYLKKDDSLDKQIKGLLNFMDKEFTDLTLGGELYQQRSDGNWGKA